MATNSSPQAISRDCDELLERLDAALETHYDLLLQTSQVYHIGDVSLAIKLWRSEVTNDTNDLSRALQFVDAELIELLSGHFALTLSVMSDIEAAINGFTTHASSQGGWDMDEWSTDLDDAVINLQLGNQCITELASTVTEASESSRADATRFSVEQQAVAGAETYYSTDAGEPGPHVRDISLIQDSRSQSPGSTLELMEISTASPTENESFPADIELSLTGHALIPNTGFMSLYEYDPLDQGVEQIRLLRLHPGLPDDPIRCELVLVSLSSLPHYETISYCWEDLVDGPCIVLNGCDFHAPTNAASALRHVRRPDTTRLVWIDAICINQADLAERSYQVANMGKIYRMASRTLVFLGEKADTDAEAVSSIVSICKEARNATNNFALFTQTLVSPERRLQYAEADLRADINITALAAFYSRPWFKRVWAMQEALVSQSNLCILGKFQFDLTIALQAVCWLRYKSATLKPLDGFNDFAGVWDAFLFQGMLDYGNRKSEFAHQPLSALLDMQKNLDATDPRDRIYGILGLSEYATLQMTVDYTKSTLEVFRDATKFAMLESQESFSMVLNNIHNKSEESLSSERLPSWVPNWRKGTYSAGRKLMNSQFRAGSHMRIPGAQVEVGVDPNVLLWPGLSVDKVVECSLALSTSSSVTTETFRIWMQNVVEISSNALTDMSLNAKRELIAKTLLCETNLTGGIASEDDVVHTSGLMLSFLDRAVVQQLDQPPMDLIDRLRDTLDYTFFRTSAGHIGMGPSIMYPGDLIVILAGAQTPVVLRKKQAHFHQLIGLAYVHGMMHGEAELDYELRGEVFAII